MKKIILSIILTVLAVSPAFADGDCPERPANQQERAAFQSTYSAAKAAVPPAQKDWAMTDSAEQQMAENLARQINLDLLKKQL